MSLHYLFAPLSSMAFKVLILNGTTHCWVCQSIWYASSFLSYRSYSRTQRKFTPWYISYLSLSLIKDIITGHQDSSSLFRVPLITKSKTSLFSLPMLPDYSIFLSQHGSISILLLKITCKEKWKKWAYNSIFEFVTYKP